MHFFIFRRFIFRLKKTSTFSFSFLFSVLKRPLKKHKKSQYFGWANARRAHSWVTCSRIQPLSTSLPAEHEYCEAVSTQQWADSVCCLCCCSWLVSIAPPNRKFLSAPTTSAAREQLFSAAGQTYSDCRSSMLGENADKLFLAYNIRLFDFKYWSLHTQRLTQWAI